MVYPDISKKQTYSELERLVRARRPAASTDVNASVNVAMVDFIVMVFCSFLAKFFALLFFALLFLPSSFFNLLLFFCFLLRDYGFLYTRMALARVG